MFARVNLIAIAVVAVVAVPRIAAAYPQFQLSRDQTCSGCHFSPAGGGLLAENGLNTAESISQFGTAPEFFYKKVPLPDWLSLGGDFRGAAGYIRTPTNIVTDIPMQADLYGHVKLSNFSLQVTVGARPPEWDNHAATYVDSREHYLMWQQNADSNDGLFVRVGRFMPVFGLRLAEHVDYDRVYGGTPLDSETYGAAVEYIEPKYEAHASGWIKDPITDGVRQDNGAAVYAEFRPDEHDAVGAEGMLQIADDAKTYRGGITGKHYFADQDTLLQFEGQIVSEVIDAGGNPVQLVGELMATKFFGAGMMLDVGLGHFDEDVRVHSLDRDALDVNLHWFSTSHLEVMWMNRLEHTYGPTGAWSMIMLHYRL